MKDGPRYEDQSSRIGVGHWVEGVRGANPNEDYSSRIPIPAKLSLILTGGYIEVQVKITD